MHPVTEAYQFGRRLGNDYRGSYPMEHPTRLIDRLADDPRYDQTVLPMLRETAGYELRTQIYPTERRGYDSGMYRRGNDETEELFERQVKPAFWHGFVRAIGY